jgi:O-antigen ligase
MRIRWVKINTYPGISLSLIAALFMVPVSTSLESICIISALFFIVFTPEFREKLSLILIQPWCFSGILLFLLSVMGCLWTSATFHEGLGIVGKYSKLLFLPLFVFGFRDRETRVLALHAFLAAMALTWVISCLKYSGLVHYHGDDPGEVFRNHIMTGYMMTFAAYLCAYFSFHTHGFTRFFYGLWAVLFSYQILFIGMGRTSYLIYLVLLLGLMWHVCSKRQALAASLVVCALFVGIYHQSAMMQHRTEEAIHDWRSYHQQAEKNTPVGFRLQFHAYAHTLFNRHPWLGNGTSGFSDAFKKEQPVPGWGETLFEPHSQYWLVAADWGLVGLLILMFYFGSLSLASWRLRECRPIALGLMVSFLLGNLLDSLLLYSGTGYFFLLLMAVCLGSKPLPARGVVQLPRGITQGTLGEQPGLS